MSTESEATLTVRTKAEIAALLEYQKALAAVNAEMREHVRLAAEADKVGAGAHHGSGGGGGTGANAGAPPPAPAARSGVIGNTGASLPNVAARPGSGAPPAGPSPPPAGGSAPPAPAPGTGGGAAAPAGPAGGAPAPAAPGAAPGAPPAPPAPPPGPGAWNPQAAGPGLTQPAASQTIRYTGGKPLTFTGLAMSGAQSGTAAGQSFLSHTASTAIGVGLGSSLLGLPLAAVNRYMTLSSVLTQLNQKFRSAAEGSEMFGTSVGYGIARSAQLAETLGGVRNQFDRSEGTRLAGFARFSGADPSTVLRSLGRVGDLQGRGVGDFGMANLMSQARNRGMDQGRFEEFLQLVTQHSESQFAATGRTSLNSSLGVMSLQNVVYGPTDPRRANDSHLLGGLNDVMTGSGPMRSYMMRAMGYGSEGGPSYIEMRKRLDAGIYDPQNVIDLFSSFQARGMGEGAMFRAIESVAGGSLKAHQIEALVKGVGSEDGLARFKDSVAQQGGPESLRQFLDTMSTGELEKFNAGGFAAVGASKVSAGETYENRIEAAMLKVGAEFAQAVPNIQDTLESLGRSLQTILGGDVGGTLERIAGSAERVAGWVERNALPWNQGGFDWITAQPYETEWRTRRGIIDPHARARGMYHGEGPISAGMEGIEAGVEFWGDQIYGEGQTDVGGGLWDSGGIDLTRPKGGGGSR